MPLLDIYPSEMSAYAYKKIRTRMLAVLFITASPNTAKKYPSTAEWSNRAIAI